MKQVNQLLYLHYSEKKCTKKKIFTFSSAAIGQKIGSNTALSKIQDMTGQ